MDKDKFCIKREYFYIFLLLIISAIIILLSKNVKTNTFSSNTKAATLLPTPTSAYNQCGPGRPCSYDKYCLDIEGNAQRCVSDIQYSAAISTIAIGKYSDGTTYKYFSDLYTYGKTAGTPNLTMNKEYVIYVNKYLGEWYVKNVNKYPGEWWVGSTDYTVTVTGVKATPTALLDPKSWSSKTITFTSTGVGTIKISLKRTDPSNGRVLTRNWTMVVNVVDSNATYNQCGPGRPCSYDKYCLDIQGDSQRCVPDIQYSAAIGTAAIGKFSGGTTYRYFGDSIYTYGKTAGTPNLTMNKEYVINVNDYQYPGERWEGITDYTVTVTGVKATPTAVLDPVNYSKNWRSKTITFTSTGVGTIKISLKRTDPSNGRILQRNWAVPVNVVYPR